MPDGVGRGQPARTEHHRHVMIRLAGDLGQLRRARLRGRIRITHVVTIGSSVTSKAGGHAFTYGFPSAAGARTLPTRPATAMIVATYGVICKMSMSSRTLRLDSTTASWPENPNSSAAATEPSGVQRPKIMAASAMKPKPELMSLLKNPTEPIVRYAPPMPATIP